MRALALLLLLAGCGGPLEEARVWAWEQHEYHLSPGSWEATPTGDCKNKALAIGERLAAQGYEVRYLTGDRTDDHAFRFHMVPAARLSGAEWQVIDMDRVHDLDSFPWRPIPYEIPSY